MTALRTLRFAAATTLAGFMLTACGGGSDEAPSQDDFTAVPAEGLPATTELAKDGSTVPVGEWGVVKYVSTDDKVTLLAIKVTDLKAGKEGDLKDLRGVGDLTKSTPYYVSYSWANIEGDTTYSPNQSIATSEGSALAVPNSFEKCKIPAALDYSASLGDEQHGCQVLSILIGPPNTVVFNSAGGSRNVTFALS